MKKNIIGAISIVFAVFSTLTVTNVSAFSSRVPLVSFRVDIQAVSGSKILVGKQSPKVGVNRKNIRVFAGGFAFEDPDEQNNDVANPFKKLGGSGDDDSLMKIDPARLLGPRLQGTNLYFVGMMGSGKSVIGDLLARSKFPSCIFLEKYS